ncbi:MAG: ATP-binding protein [Clostridia bacterium]|nr:ATP-binding protein [Clostridia bacterium]
MKKSNKPLRIVVFVFILEIIVIGTLGVSFNKRISLINNKIERQEIRDVRQVQEECQDIVQMVNIQLAIGMTISALMTILLAIYLSHMIIYPLKKMIESKEKKEKAEEVEIKTRLLHMTEGIIAFNIDGKIDLINPAAKMLLKISPEDYTFEDIFNKFNLDINMEKLIYLEELTSLEQVIEVEDKTVKVLFSPFKNEKTKNPEGIIAVIQDITENVKLDTMRKEFVADVSHELKTPITSIMGYTDTLLEGDYDQETQKEFLQVVSSEARRMAKLVTDLLELSRMDNNKKRIKKVSFDLGNLAKECQKKLAIEIKKKKHHVECLVTADVPPVYADKDDIQRVILNILSNSIKYTPEGGTIKIYVGFVYSDAYIKIIDNGIGIPEEDLNRIFERFYRVDKSRAREMGGTGLGLSIAKEILDKNGGSIDIKSQINKGTEVVIKIPTK